MMGDAARESRPKQSEAEPCLCSPPAQLAAPDLVSANEQSEHQKLRV